MNEQSQKLIELAHSFRELPLTAAEIELMKLAASDRSGVEIEKPYDQPQLLNKDEVDSLRGQWDVYVSGELLRWLLTDDSAKKLIRARHLVISGCIFGLFDLSDAVLSIKLTFDHCIFPNRINLERCQTLDLSFNYCWLEKIDGRGMMVKGDLLLLDSRTNWGIMMPSSKIIGDFSYSGGNCRGIIDADGITVSQNFNLYNISFPPDIGPSLSLIQAKIQGNVNISDIGNLGFIRADAASISRNFEILKATFAQRDYPNGIHAPGIVVGGELIWAPGEPNRETQLRLSNGKAFTFADNKQSWVEPGNLNILNFTYTELKDVEIGEGFISRQDEFDFKRRLAWIRLQPYWGLSKQPYEEYACWLRSKGHMLEATEVLIVSEHDRRSYLNKSNLSRFWSWFLRVTTGYGYRPLLSLLWIMAFVLIGYAIFSWSYMNNALISTGSGVSPTAFNPLIYSLDTFLPVINFGQADYWIPTGKSNVGLLAQWYWWLHIALGWIFTTVAVAGFTGLVRK